jgi:hypothetical protein
MTDYRLQIIAKPDAPMVYESAICDRVMESFTNSESSPRHGDLSELFEFTEIPRDSGGTLSAPQVPDSPGNVPYRSTNPRTISFQKGYYA